MSEPRIRPNDVAARIRGLEGGKPGTPRGERDALLDLRDEREKNARLTQELEQIKTECDTGQCPAAQHERMARAAEYERLREALRVEADEWDRVTLAWDAGDSRREAARKRARALRALAGDSTPIPPEFDLARDTASMLAKLNDNERAAFNNCIAQARGLAARPPLDREEVRELVQAYGRATGRYWDGELGSSFNIMNAAFEAILDYVCGPAPDSGEKT